MAIHELKPQIARLPEQPGVYLFLNAAGETLYVGKARVLRDRVRSYLGALGASPRIDALLRDAAAVETIVTDSVVEALALENQLIKQRAPRFNVLLRDDKTYPYLQLTVTEPAPRLLVARRVERDGSVYAGPFMPALVARRTMTLAHRLLGIRSCNEVIDGRRDRPCLEYDIGRCLAPCVADVCTLDRYGRAVEQARLLIEGRQDELLEDLRQEMGAASAGEQFERAAHLRDAIRTLETVRDRRNALETPALGDRDAFGLHRGASGAVVTVFQMRRGRVVDRLEFGVAGPEAGQDPGAEDSADGRARSLVRAAILECYADRQAPAEVHLPVPLEEDDHAAIEAWLSVSRTVRIVVPRRGDKRGLLNLAARNATLAYQARFAGTGLGAFDALDGLRALLALSALPRRIECIDISTLQGRDTVGALVVAVDGRLRPADYRKFRVRGPATPPTPEADFLVADDVGAVREVVARRYQRVLEAGGPFPDLIVIDGGKGQLGAAYLGLRDVGLDRLVAIGLAKKEELIFTRDRDDGLALPRDAAPLRLLQQLRDEAHRFALTFHRTRRAARQLRSGLDEIHGIGPRRRAALLTTFGSLAGVRRASRQDLETVVGARAADAVIRHFEGRATSG